MMSNYLGHYRRLFSAGCSASSDAFGLFSFLHFWPTKSKAHRAPTENLPAEWAIHRRLRCLHTSRTMTHAGAWPKVQMRISVALCPSLFQPNGIRHENRNAICKLMRLDELFLVSSSPSSSRSCRPSEREKQTKTRISLSQRINNKIFPRSFLC